jgi:hypothetical protein
VTTIVQCAAETLRIKQVEERFSALRSSVICSFNQLLDLKDLNTGVHSTRLAEWGMRVGQELGLSEEQLQNLEVAALLHDIGKTGIDGIESADRVNEANKLIGTRQILQYLDLKEAARGCGAEAESASRCIESAPNTVLVCASRPARASDIALSTYLALAPEFLPANPISRGENIMRTSLFSRNLVP